MPKIGIKLEGECQYYDV